MSPEGSCERRSLGHSGRSCSGSRGPEQPQSPPPAPEDPSHRYSKFHTPWSILRPSVTTWLSQKEVIQPLLHTLGLFLNNHQLFWGEGETSLVAQMVKRLPTMRETRVRSLGQEDPLEKEMAIHSSTIAWKIPWTEEPSRLRSMGSQSQTRLSDFTFTVFFFKQPLDYQDLKTVSFPTEMLPFKTTCSLRLQKLFIIIFLIAWNSASLFLSLKPKLCPLVFITNTISIPVMPTVSQALRQAPGSQN